MTAVFANCEITGTNKLKQNKAHGYRPFFTVQTEERTTCRLWIIRPYTRRCAFTERLNETTLSVRCEKKKENKLTKRINNALGNSRDLEKRICSDAGNRRSLCELLMKTVCGGRSQDVRGGHPTTWRISI